ncbi:MAG: c-type cytochrome [Gammaproteobacteria bacterium]|nr:c-type cytochrome [Gammaproteobacteria bacterium]
MDKFIGPDYEQGLVNLKTLAESTPPAAVTPATPPAVAASSPASSTGLELARMSGCLACHSIDRKVVGPAWKDVAARYKNHADAKPQLINKVKTGGKGNWADVTGGAPMPPYSPRVSDTDITTLVEFVLAL